MNDAPMDAAQSAAEDAATRLKKDLVAVKNDIAHLSRQIADAVNALAAVAQNQGRRLRHARADVAKDAASSIADTLTEAIQERPVAAVALATAVGFVMGVAWRR
jgi:ElaB/YqjD/DUF883 family membrane-anchored ribosome-binding protein